MSTRSLPALTPIARQSLSDAVFEQLRAQIVGGDIAAGDPLPSERILCEALGVNRGAVREALRRLEQARLVSVRHGGTSRALDYRQHAGLDLLDHLLVTPAGEFDIAVVRSVMEMRSAIAPDAARWAAERRTLSQCDALDRVLAAMRQRADDLIALQGIAVDFWAVLITAADNIAYRLAYNTLRATYSRCDALLVRVLEPELRNLDAYGAIAQAIRAHDSGRAEQQARALVRLGEASVKVALEQMENLKTAEGK